MIEGGPGLRYSVTRDKGSWVLTEVGSIQDIPATRFTPAVKTEGTIVSAVRVRAKRVEFTPEGIHVLGRLSVDGTDNTLCVE